MKFIVFLLFTLAAPLVLASSTLNRALQAGASNDFVTALPLWEQLGNEGEKKAMVEAALIYHQGLGRPVDYTKALDWYLKAKNGDSINNMGVMFRDGTGLPQNRKIAYLMFLTVHMQGMGNEATIMRANKNLRREIAEIPQKDISDALCYTMAYLVAYVESRGRITGIPENLRASSERKRIKELDWWLDGEIAAYKCHDEQEVKEK